MSKIIDFERKGNVVRFFLGANNCKDYWGDDWDDRPYEHNAGNVYDAFVTGYIDIAFNMDYNVLDAASDYSYQGNSPYCKDDFKKRKAPCIVVLPPEVVEEDYLYSDAYSKHLGNKRALRFYYEDSAETILKCLHGTVIAYVPDIQVLNDADNNRKEDQV